MINGWGISCEIVPRWISLDHTDDKSTWVQVMAWCHQATSHYLSQCWPRSMLPYGVTRPQWVKACPNTLTCDRPTPSNGTGTAPLSWNGYNEQAALYTNDFPNSFLVTQQYDMIWYRVNSDSTKILWGTKYVCDDIIIMVQKEMKRMEGSLIDIYFLISYQ